MTERQALKIDLAKVTDKATPNVNAVLLDRMEFSGRLVVERFTPGPDMDPMRPLEVMGEITKLQRGLGLGQAEVDARIADLEAELADVRSDLFIVPNLITQVGDQYYGERASGIVGAPGQVTGMRLGTGVTAAAKTGAGAAIVTYKAGSAKAIDGSFPTSALVVASRVITWKTSWGPGVVNGSALTEAVITNETPLTDVTGSAADTISRALFGPTTLGALDTFSITWAHSLLGA